MNRRALPKLRNGTSPSSSHPDAFQAAVVVTKTLRFQSNAAFNTTFQANNWLDLLCMADTAVTAQRLFSSMKVHSIKMWGPMASTLVPVSVSCEFHTDAIVGVGAPNKITSDTSMGSNSCAYLHCGPPANSLAAMWQSRAANQPLVTLTGPVNTVIDVSLSLCLQNGEAALAVANALVGATVGTVYCRGLDAIAAAGTVFPPTSYATA